MANLNYNYFLINHIVPDLRRLTKSSPQLTPTVKLSLIVDKMFSSKMIYIKNLIIKIFIENILSLTKLSLINDLGQHP